MTKNLLKSNYKVTTILDIDASKCSNYPCKVASSPRQLAEEVDVTITGKLMTLKDNDKIKSLMILIDDSFAYATTCQAML